jgi:hypothetical protein
MIFITIVLLFPTTPLTTASGMNYTVVVLGGWILLSLIWYYFPKYGGVYWFKGPVANVENNDQKLGQPESSDAHTDSVGTHDDGEKK